jgi:cytochrome c553
VDIPLPWERLLWIGRPVRFSSLAGERYVLTDFRLVRVHARGVDEIVLHDIGDVQRTESRLDRLLGTSTIVVHARPRDLAPVVLIGIRRGPAVAALLELLSGDPQTSIDSDAARDALAWEPRARVGTVRDAVVASAVVLIVMFSIVIGLHGTSETPVTYAADDPIAPNGRTRSRAEIVRFMENDVMPWARETFGPLKGGADRVTCATCHGRDAAARNWAMPSVAALPEPVLRYRGWETYSAGLDAQIRNAIYGYIAESEKQATAAYMREVVVPGMSRLLRRPPYDFTKPYEYNRIRRALGCYHCHKVR